MWGAIALAVLGIIGSLLEERKVQRKRKRKKK